MPSCKRIKKKKHRVRDYYSDKPTSKKVKKKKYQKYVDQMMAGSLKVNLENLSPNIYRKVTSMKLKANV